MNLDAGVRGVEGDQREHAFGCSGQLDRHGNLAAAGGVEDRIDALRSDGADPFQQSVTVGNGYRADRPQVVVIALAGGSDDRHTTCCSELDGEGAYPAGCAVDEKRLAGFDTELFQHGVRGSAGSRSDPATSQAISWGLRTRLVGSASAYSANDGVTELPKTSSPTANSLTPGPTWSTTPDASAPTPAGRVSGILVAHRAHDRFRVDGIDSRGPYGNSNLPLSGCRCRHVDYP